MRIMSCCPCFHNQQGQPGQVTGIQPYSTEVGNKANDQAMVILVSGTTWAILLLSTELHPDIMRQQPLQVDFLLTPPPKKNHTHTPPTLWHPPHTKEHIPTPTLISSISSLY